MPTIGGIDLGNLTDYLFVFTGGSTGANWQGASVGYLGDVGIDGATAVERTSAQPPFAGTIYTNAPTLEAWEAIVLANPGQACGGADQTQRIARLEADLASAFAQINALAATPGYETRSSTSLNGLNTRNGVDETLVINITSGLSVASKITITGDPGDVFILRWDRDPVTPGYQGQVRFSRGGAIVPAGGLTPANFINVAGDISSAGGGTNPPPPYPQGPRYDNGQGPLIIGGSDWEGGGFFTGYWLTTGSPCTGRTRPLTNGVFVGGWYTSTASFCLAGGSGGVHVTPATVPGASISLEKLVSVDGGATFQHVSEPPGPTLVGPMAPQYRFLLANDGGVPLTDIALIDSALGSIPLPVTMLAAGESFPVTVVGTFASGEHCNTATATARYPGGGVQATDAACWSGETAACTVTGYQTVCLDADISITAAATPGMPEVACLTTPAVLPFGTRTCEETEIPCGFSAQATLCVMVPVTFGATATVAEVRQECEKPTPTPCPCADV